MHRQLELGDENDLPKALADLIRNSHKSDTLTLVVLNRVSRRREVYEMLRRAGSRYAIRQRLPSSIRAFVPLIASGTRNCSLEKEMRERATALSSPRKPSKLGWTFPPAC